MSSLLAREEPLLKQLVRSRACKRRDPLSVGFGPQIRNTRSFSQPPPRQREPVPQQSGTLTPPNKIPVSPGSPGTYYTLQLLPYSLVCQTPSLIPVSLSQPDLRKCGINADLCGSLTGIRGFCSQASSRCSSVSPMRCPSPLPLSPHNGSCYSTRPGTPTNARGACSPVNSRPTTPTIYINSQELFYAGGTDYFSNDHPPDYLRAFHAKTGLNANLTQKCNNNGSTRSSREDLKLAANWEQSLEVERFEARKYSLTDNIIFPPRPETTSGEVEMFSQLDANNNGGSFSRGQSPSRQQQQQQRPDSWLSSPCCCFNDLCCKVCLVFNKEDSNLTLEQLQSRAIENVLKQRKLEGSIRRKACACSACNPRSPCPSPSRQSHSPDNTIVSAKKRMIATPESLQKKVKSYEVLMLTSKCGVCGLPDRGPVGLGHGQFPCGHSAIGGHPRRTSNVSVGSLYNNHTMADSASPAQSPTAHFLGIGGVGPQQQQAATPTPYSPVKDSSSKSLLASICSASGSNQGAIDNRIEQAMDLVKSHLMNAVRSEVEELKEKIIKLEEIISQLQSENEFLRANVNRDVLLQLQQQQQLQLQQQQQALGSPPSQAALPPVQQQPQQPSI